MKKKIWLIALVAALAALLCGCGGGAGGGGESKSPSLDKTELTLIVGTEGQLAVLNRGDAEVEWKSSDETVATVTPEGSGAYVTALAEGNAVISALIGGEEFARCTVTVKGSPLSIFLPKPERLVLRKNESATVKAISEVELTGTPKWSVSDPTIGAVDFNGLTAIVTGLARGECTITVTCDGYSASFTLMVGTTG